MKTFKEYITEGWGDLDGEKSFVTQKNGRRVYKLLIPPVDKLSFPTIVWRVEDKNGNIVLDTSTIFPRPYFTSETDAVAAMNSDVVGVSRDRI